MFLLKKFIASFLMPMPIFFMLAALGLYLLYAGRRRRAVQVWAASLVWIALLSYAPFSTLLLKPLESAYPQWQPGREAPAYIHVLGYGHHSDARLPLSSRPYPPGLARVIEGVMVYRHSNGAKLVFSGYGGDDKTSDARVNAALAAALGVAPGDIIMLESPRDTAEEAQALKKIAGTAPVVLVTSAAHMPRAMALFKHMGINATPAPTDFEATQTPWLQWPGSAGLHLSERAFHEYLGLLWMKLVNHD